MNSKITYRFIIIFFFVSLNFILSKSEEGKFKVDKIEITGNETTKDYIILRELNFSIGDSVTQAQLDFNSERVFSLGIFRKVELKINNKNEINILEISVKESWYIYPLPYLKLRENSFKRATYGLYILYKNFRGRNETIWGVITFGYNPTYYIKYLTPVLFNGSNLSFEVNLGYTSIQNRRLIAENLYGDKFTYHYIFSGFTLGYRINQFNKIYNSYNFEYMDFPKEVKTLTASNSSIDRVFSAGIAYEYDNRDLKQFSTNGLLAVASLVHKGFSTQNDSYNIFNLDVRKYNTIIGNLSGKWRVKLRNIFEEKIPFYSLSLLGDDEYLRGHRFNRREGKHYFLTSMEFNYPILKEWDFSVKLPLLQRRLTSARIGIYINLFFDSGTTFNKYEKLNLNNFNSGWGGGLTLLILPYNAIRFEYAVNEFNKSEFLLQTGFSF